MNDLVERYVNQVGRYLPGGERKEIQNELRSLIRDQLDDRYKASPTEDDVVIEEVSSNEDMLDQLFQSVLGPSNRKVDRITSVKLDEANEAGNLAVTWTINDNSSAAKVKNGAWTDIKKILQVVQDSGVPVNKMVLVGTFSDGGAKEGQVIRATYSWSKVKTLDVGAANPSRIVAIADSFQAQPGFR